MPDDNNSPAKWEKNVDGEMGGDIFIFVTRDKNGKVVEIARLGNLPRKCPIMYSIQAMVSDIKDGPCDEPCEDHDFSALIDKGNAIVNEFADTFECPGVCPVPKKIVGNVGIQRCEFNEDKNECLYYIVAVKKIECFSV